MSNLGRIALTREDQAVEETIVRMSSTNSSLPVSPISNPSAALGPPRNLLYSLLPELLHGPRTAWEPRPHLHCKVLLPRRFHLPAVAMYQNQLPLQVASDS